MNNQPPRYVPDDLHGLASSDNEDALLALMRDGYVEMEDGEMVYSDEVDWDGLLEGGAA